MCFAEMNCAKTKRMVCSAEMKWTIYTAGVIVLHVPQTQTGFVALQRHVWCLRQTLQNLLFIVIFTAMMKWSVCIVESQQGAAGS